VSRPARGLSLAKSTCFHTGNCKWRRAPLRARATNKPNRAGGVRLPTKFPRERMSNQLLAESLGHDPRFEIVAVGRVGKKARGDPDSGHCRAHLYGAGSWYFSRAPSGSLSRHARTQPFEFHPATASHSQNVRPHDARADPRCIVRFSRVGCSAALALANGRILAGGRSLIGNDVHPGDDAGCEHSHQQTTNDLECCCTAIRFE
jgi:hypothetical protein